MHNEQVIQRCQDRSAISNSYLKLAVAVCSASKVGWDGEQVVAGRKGKK